MILHCAFTTSANEGIVAHNICRELLSKKCWTVFNDQTWMHTTANWNKTYSPEKLTWNPENWWFGSMSLLFQGSWNLRFLRVILVFGCVWVCTVGRNPVNSLRCQKLYTNWWTNIAIATRKGGGVHLLYLFVCRYDICFHVCSQNTTHLVVLEVYTDYTYCQLTQHRHQVG